jgi:hypothetical protein
MEQAEISKNNKLIAEFMGLSRQLHMTEHLITGEYISSDEMEFNSSWDWLMPVMEKIEKITVFCVVMVKPNGGTLISVLDVDDNVLFEAHPKAHSPIRNAYRAVIRFVEWYNNTLS